MLGEAEWHWWNYTLITIGFSGLLYSTYPLFQRAWTWTTKGKEERPDCTFDDLHNYLNAQCATNPPRLEVDVEVMFGFRLLSKFLSQKLFEDKVKAWGKETRENKVSPKETLIPREYWEFNRLDLEERAIDMHSAEEITYTSLRFNQRRMIEQMEFLFSNYEEIQEQLRETNLNEEQYWKEQTQGEGKCVRF